MAVNVSLDSVLERALAESGAVSPQDAILVALHATLLSTGFVCVAIGDQVCSPYIQLYTHFPLVLGVW